MRQATIVTALLLAVLLPGGARAQGGAGADPGQPAQADGQAEQARKEPSLQEKYRARFPQPVEAGRLIGLEVTDADENVIGHVRDVVRLGDGTVQIVFDYLSFLWREGELVPVPLEAVALVGRQLAILDMPREVIEKRPTWYGVGGSSVPRDERIAVALTKR